MSYEQEIMIDFVTNVHARTHTHIHTYTHALSLSCQLCVKAIAKAGYTGRIKLGMDVAASEFFADGKYDLDFKTKKNDGSKVVDADGLSAIYKNFVHKFPVASIEDPFDQDDWAAYVKLNAALGATTQIVGDDLLVTNTKRIG